MPDKKEALYREIDARIAKTKEEMESWLEEMTSKTMPDRVLSVSDVAEMCRVSNETIRRWIRKHGLRAYDTTGGGAIKIMESDLRTFAEELNVFVDWNYLDEKTDGSQSP